MATGKKTGGRTKGTRNKASVKREKEIASSGLTPLAYMLRIMRNTKADTVRRDDMAKAAAPYVHPKLAAIEHTGEGGGPIQTEDVSLIEAARRMAFAFNLAIREGKKTAA
jgi:hypothetical protein